MTSTKDDDRHGRLIAAFIAGFSEEAQDRHKTFDGLKAYLVAPYNRLSKSRASSG